jgi:hypothetical protein
MSAESTIGRKRPTDVSPTFVSRELQVDSVRPRYPRISAIPSVFFEQGEIPYGSFMAMLGRYPLLTAEL